MQNVLSRLHNMMQSLQPGDSLYDVHSPNTVEDISTWLNLQQVIISRDIMKVSFLGIEEIRAWDPNFVDSLPV